MKDEYPPSVLPQSKRSVVLITFAPFFARSTRNKKLQSVGLPSGNNGKSWRGMLGRGDGGRRHRLQLLRVRGPADHTLPSMRQ